VIVACDRCGRQNRVPVERLAQEGRCGACHAPLGPRAKPIDVDAADFDAIVGAVKVPILVDFWAAWCAPCRMAAPEVEKTAAAMAGKSVVLKVNTELQPALASRFHVQGIPHFVVLRDGAVVTQQSGLVPSARMTEWLEAASRRS